MVARPDAVFPGQTERARQIELMKNLSFRHFTGRTFCCVTMDVVGGGPSVFFERKHE
jgi:hypothetical protein